MASGSTGAGDADGGGEAALRAALDEHGEDLAAVVERTDEITDVVELVVLTIATADEAEVEHVTELLATLVQAVDGLAGEGAVALAEAVGEDGEALATAVAALARLEREGQLDALVDLAGTLSTVEVDEETAAGLDRLAEAVGDAEAGAEPVGVLGFLGGLRSPDARAGLGYLLALLRGLGRRG